MPPFFSLPDAFSPVDCDRIIKLATRVPMKEAGLVRKTRAPTIRSADLAWIDEIPGAGWVLDRLVRVVADANNSAFNYALDEFAESPQVARYGSERQDHFDWHTDIGAGEFASRRKLTIVVQLTETDLYEGGALELRPDSNVVEITRSRGTATVFPSFVLHRVTPVTTGTRWSLTLWAHGPAFQ